VCSLSWREPKNVQRPMTGSVKIFSPFEVVTTPLTLEEKK
jgi:hypothetical protein